MAKQYEQYKKDYAAWLLKLAEAELYTTKTKTNRVHFDNLLKEHGRAVGRRVHTLRENGAAGATLDDFKNDVEVKKLIAEADHYVHEISETNKRTIALETSDWKTLVATYKTLQTDLAAEIATRKKAVSTALGAGNKSLPDMVKLAAEVEKAKIRVKKFNSYSTSAKGMFNVSLYREPFDETVKEELAKSKSQALSEEQAGIFESILADRNLRITLATAQSIARKVTQAVSDAQAAQLAKQAETLKTAQATATNELKRLDDIAAKHRKAYDTIGETAILTTKVGPKIKQTVLALESLKQKAHVEFAKLPNK